MESEWKKATSGEVVKLAPGENLEGVFVGIEVSKQFTGSYAFKVKQGDDIKTVFVNNIVSDLINTNQIKPGMSVRLLMMNKKKNKKGQEYSDYELEFK